MKQLAATPISLGFAKALLLLQMIGLLNFVSARLGTELYYVKLPNILSVETRWSLCVCVCVCVCVITPSC